MSSESQRNKVLASIAWYMLAFTLTTILHEWAHGIVGWGFGREPTIHLAQVVYRSDVSPVAQICASAAGPLFSLAQGLLVWIGLRGRTLPWHAQAFGSWFADHGATCFLGYVFTASFARDADVGNVLARLGAPLVVAIAFTIAGYLGIRRLAYMFAPSFAWILADEADDESARRRAVKMYLMLPAFGATPLLLLTQWPLPHWVCAVYIVCSAFPLFDMPNAFSATSVSWRTDAPPMRSSLLVLVAMVAVIGAARAILLPGVTLH